MLFCRLRRRRPQHLPRIFNGRASTAFQDSKRDSSSQGVSSGRLCLRPVVTHTTFRLCMLALQFAANEVVIFYFQLVRASPCQPRLLRKSPCDSFTEYLQCCVSRAILRFLLRAPCIQPRFLLELDLLTIHILFPLSYTLVRLADEAQRC